MHGQRGRAEEAGLSASQGPEVKHCVYVIRCTLDPVFVYVGTTTDPHHRWIKHCSTSSRCKKLKNAIKKNGREFYFMEIVAVFFDGPPAYKFESELIDRMRSDGHRFYNMTSGGKGAPNRTVRKGTRSKLSRSMKATLQKKREQKLDKDLGGRL